MGKKMLLGLGNRLARDDPRNMQPTFVVFTP
jgi:hypothetical protein